MGSALEDLREFPAEVQADIGYGLWVAQRGERPPQAKVMKGIVRGAGVLELIQRQDRDTYRVVYTVRFKDAVYVLHAFQKESKRGIKAPQADIDLILARLKAAEAHDEERDR
jgi:phage-related protein